MDEQEGDETKVEGITEAAGVRSTVTEVARTIKDVSILVLIR